MKNNENETLNSILKKSEFYKNYKTNHKMSDEFKRQMDKDNPIGTKIVDTITGEVYITQKP